MSYKKNLSWSIGGTLTNQVISFISGIVLARILGPKEFGVSIMILVIINIITQFADPGISDSIITLKKINKKLTNSFFSLQIIIGLFLFVISNLIPIIFYDFKFQLYFFLASSNILIGSFSSVQKSLFIRNMNFDKISFVETLSNIISSIVVVVFALNGFGVISVVSKPTFTRLFAFLIIIFLSKEKLKFVLDFSAIKHLKNNKYIFFQRPLEDAFNFVKYNYINHNFNIVTTGLFNRAETLTNSATLSLRSLKRLNFSTFSKDTHISTFLKTQYLIATGSVVICLLFFNFSQFIIDFIFGSKWLNASEPLKYATIGVLFLPLAKNNLTYLNSLGKSKEAFVISMFTSILVVAVYYLVQIEDLINFIHILNFILFLEFLISSCYINLKKLLPILGLTLLLTSLITLVIIYLSFTVLQEFISLSLFFLIISLVVINNKNKIMSLIESIIKL